MNYFRFCVWLALVSSLPTMVCRAEGEAVSGNAREVSIAPGPLGKALSDYAKAMDLEILLDPALAKGKSSAGLSGLVTPREGLRRLLAGSDLDFDLEGGSAILHRAKPSSLAAGGNGRHAAAEPEEADQVIVTGTRLSDVRASESSTPIEIVSGEALSATGRNTLFDALKDLVPAISSVRGTDYGLFSRSARFRGLPAGETLVLINGKRRHTSAYLDTATGEDVGSNPVDLDLIPLGLVDHVEVLLDGAAAQYGSDAIAGVINIILKSADQGASATVGGGVTSRGDGAQGEATAIAGYSLGPGGFLTVTAGYVHHDFSLRDQGIPATYGNSFAFGKNGTSKLYNRFYGDPLSDLPKGGYNFALPVNFGGTDAEFYGFGTIAYRATQGYENYRAPSVAPQIYPQGFYPRETLSEWDFAVTEGLRGTVGGWKWDFSNVFGRDDFRQGLFNTVNSGLLVRTGSSPTSANTGALISAQSTTNLDISRSFARGLGQVPLTVAAGLEHRYESFQQLAGQPISYLYGGTAAFSGYTPQDASDSARQVGSAYLDLTSSILPAWQFDITGRFDDYSDVGAAKSGRLSTRYDLTDGLALRGTINNGFHAPTLAQQHFGITNVNPSPSGGLGEFYQLLLPPASPGARVLGAPSLRPETDQDATIGIVATPTDRLRASLDVYQIYLQDRIAEVGPVSIGNNPLSPQLLAAVAAQGFTVPPNSSAEVLYLTNAANSRSRGIDLAVDYRQEWDGVGSLVWSLAANQNDVSLIRVAQPPTQLVVAGLGNFNPQTANYFTKSQPQNKVTLAANLLSGPWNLLLRETRWGPSVYIQAYGSPPTYLNVPIPTAYLTDAALAYQVSESLTLSLGGNNIFDRMPPYNPPQLRSVRNGPAYVIATPYGDDGAYFYGRAILAF
jgi:iron complex outermembrane receptor protein